MPQLKLLKATVLKGISCSVAMGPNSAVLSVASSRPEAIMLKLYKGSSMISILSSRSGARFFSLATKSQL